MKPLQLSLQAFGPFSSKITVDFARLDSSALCLVHGATGAGKTTLLDGICFALYTSTSGGERTPKQMRCDAAPERLRTEVEFIFSSRGRRYRIVRVPEQTRKKRKGEGTTEAKAEVQLFIAVDSKAKAGNDEHWELLFAKSKPVDDEIQRILGLNADQFRQVALLPQGKFRSFLLATSQDREDILEALFRTERFSRLKDVLLEKERTLRKNLEDSDQKRQAWLEQFHLKTKEEVLGELEKLSAFAQKIDAEIDQLSGAKNLQQKQLILARENLRRHREWSDAKQAHLKLESSLSSFEKEDAKLQAAERAEQSRVSVECFQQVENETSRQALVVKMLKQDLEEIHFTYKEVEKNLAVAQEKMLPVDDMREQLVGIKNLLKNAEQNLKEVTHLKGLQRRHQALVEEQDVLQTTSDQLSKQLKEQRSRYDQDLLCAQSLERHREALGHFSQRRKQRQELEDSRIYLAKQSEKLKKIEVDLSLLLEKSISLREKLDFEDALLLAEAAAALRLELEPDCPCPVCGSNEHILEVEDDKIEKPSSATKRKRLKGQLAKAEKAHQEAQDQRVNAASDLATADERVRSLLLTLGADAQRSLDELGASELERMVSFAKSEEAFDRLAEHKKTKETLQEEQQKTEAALATLLPQLQNVQEEKLRLEGALLVKSDDRSLSELKKTAHALKKDLETRVKSHQKMGLLQNETATRRDLLLERLEGEENHLVVVKSKQASAKKDMDASLERVGFANLEDWKKVFLPAADRSALSEKVHRSRRERAVVQARLQETSKNRPQEVPDVEHEEEALTSLDATLQKAKGDQGELRVRKLQLDDLIKRLDALQATHSDVKVQYEQVARLTRKMVGDNALKLPFQRFVVGKLFDGVLHAASRRLEKMTRGRFALVRVQAEGKGRGYRGLDLNVVDNRTQTMRSVATLSGGESFLAALSLSLGLADAVRERTGGVELDSVFLDEGFAGLDPESLEDALGALEILARGGRLVVVVSHVDELKERIPSRLEVTGGALGSGVRLILPHDVDVKLDKDRQNSGEEKMRTSNLGN